MVFPKPSFIVLTIVSGGKVVRARNAETRNRAINAFSFKVDVRMIIAMMLIATSIEIVTRLIGYY